MLIYLLLILIVTAVSLTAILWAGTFFFQGYIYTEPSAGIFWQAPATAALLTVGYTIWCLSVAFSTGATPQNIPYDTPLRFTPKEDMHDLNGRPAPKIWAIKGDRKKTGDDRDGERVAYISKRDGPTRFHYEDTSGARRPWQAQNVIAIEIQKPDETKMRFNLVPTEVGGYREFVSPDGWVMREYEEGPTGTPVRFRFTRLLANVFFNAGHLVVWFLGLCLILRFQWGHALGFAVVMWLIVTLVILPMVLGYAGLVAANRQAPTAALLWSGFFA